MRVFLLCRARIVPWARGKFTPAAGHMHRQGQLLRRGTMRKHLCKPPVNAAWCKDERQADGGFVRVVLPCRVLFAAGAW